MGNNDKCSFWAPSSNQSGTQPCQDSVGYQGYQGLIGPAGLSMIGPPGPAGRNGPAGLMGRQGPPGSDSQQFYVLTEWTGGATNLPTTLPLPDLIASVDAGGTYLIDVDIYLAFFCQGIPSVGINVVSSVGTFSRFLLTHTVVQETYPSFSIPAPAIALAQTVFSPNTLVTFSLAHAFESSSGRWKVSGVVTPDSSGTISLRWGGCGGFCGSGISIQAGASLVAAKQA